eukprot:CAMPEP_0172212714 /NCGR_PEP_ID=MMETSP1050-20130122/37187_1 /TAXON_ID=233186 /ORGANISM="Cryptomonas curvata, Strain CCAP979/52" /LENGTH=47 /DNA_ID= /DNA_START= /DNA_END= /DNA_ORIENTATION=
MTIFQDASLGATVERCMKALLRMLLNIPTDVPAAPARDLATLAVGSE